ncbi:MAG: hypothetical protein DI536_34435 [Archangium gephyra]|uniref:DUF4272 domain-containing protein n=1 Tax=Archangium gephyra TaxID=48 RepID=A0A2W5SN52_9BACT|nr:MAG: hypothetical protein DI536_34435 [Archangium gephyra]
MTDHCTLYVPLPFFPSADQLTPLARGAKVEVNDAARTARITWRGLEVQLTCLPPGDVGEHLQGLAGYVAANGGNPALQTRVLHTRSVYGCTIEPGFDDEGRVAAFVGGLAHAANGLRFEGGDLFGPDGRSILRDGALPTPDARRVLARARVLLALAVRGLLEDDTGTPQQADAEALRQKLAAWANAEVADELEPDERDFLHAPLGKVDRQDVVNAVWQAEGAQVLLWALKLQPLPPHDGQVHPYEVAKTTGVLSPPPPALHAATLRPAGEIEALRRALLGIHWRLVEFRVKPGPVDFVAFAQKNWFGGFSLSGVALADKDLAVGGVPLSQAEPQQVGLTSSIALERHRAANWLIGAEPVYSRVVAPT